MKISHNNNIAECRMSTVSVKSGLTPEDILKIEKAYDAKFIGAFCNKSYAFECAFPYFYQEELKDPKHSHYFTIYRDANVKVLMIAGGGWLEGLEFTGMIVGDQIYYSSHRHHYNSVGEYFIDGGLDYVRTNNQNLVSLRIIDGEILMDNKV